MNFSRRQFLHVAGGAVALPGLSRTAGAQAYPTRPITIVVPFAAGGGNDVTARILAQRLGPALGQNVIVENVTGANGSIGVSRVARGAGDGYTLVSGSWNTFVANGAVYALSYNLVDDFAPIAPVVFQPLFITSKKVMPADDLKALVAWLKANPDKASAGTSGVGSLQHVAALEFQRQTGTRYAIVPYRGGGPAIHDLVGGQIDLMLGVAADVVEYVRAGSIKAYAVTAKGRSAAAPGIPTVDEAGLPGLYFSSWQAVFAPKTTPRDAIAKLNAAIIVALADPTVRQRLAEFGLEIPVREQQTPEALSALQKADIEKWWPIIKAAGIKAE
jgi:tripartite-type tricarboxylate transporter receptor subunit TctC